MITPDGVRSKAFRALVLRLQTHPQLKGAVKTWKTWEGKPDDEAPPALGGLLPYVRLTPVTMAAVRRAASTRMPRGTIVLSPLRVNIETVVAGSRWDDAANLWERFESALWPQDVADRAAWEAKRLDLGIGDLKLLQPALPTGLENLSTDLTVSDGSIQLDIQLYL